MGSELDSRTGSDARFVVGFACVALATVCLVFAAPFFIKHPRWLSTSLIALVVVHVFLLSRIVVGPAGRPALFVPILTAIFLQAIFVFAPFYFSDDSIRHIFDGVYLLKGVDVYSVPPVKLGTVAGLVPNHPELPTVYLPFTQAQALLGALISERYGFLLVYHFVCAFLIAGVFALARGDERGLLALLVFSPFFVLASASRHADVQGLLLVLLCLLLIKKTTSFSAFCLGGFAAALLPGLKPEGILWLGGLTGLVLLRDLSQGRLRFFAAWCGGVFPLLLAQGIFARIIMFPTSEALEGFRSTAIFFSNWFTAYNPFIALRSGPDGVLLTAIQEYRRIFLLLFATLTLMVAVWLLQRSLQKVHERGAAWFWAIKLPLLLLMFLCGMLLSRAVWNPWYFLWLLPALWLVGRLKIAAGLLALLPLFYLPVIQLRFRGDWDFSTFLPFYFFTAIAALLWILLTGMGAHPLIRRIWDPDKNHP